MKSLLLIIALFADLPPEAVDAEIAITAQVVRIESVIPLPDDFERKQPSPEPKRPSNPQPNTPEPKPSPSTHCDCGGSGYITDAKNWKRVRCPCGKNCKCGSKGIAPPADVIAVADVPRANRGVIVSQDIRKCPPCRVLKETELPKMERSEWLINQGPQSHLLVLDFDNDSGGVAELLELPGAPERINFLPAFFRLEGNKITDTHEGSMTADQIARFVYPSLKQEAGEPAKSAPGSGASGGQVCPRCGKVHAAPQVMQFQPVRQFLWWQY